MSRRTVALAAGLAVLYFLAARAGLTLAFVHASATPVWPPSGIALAALLLFGRGLWPGVFLGAFVANVMTVAPGAPAAAIATSLLIATGNTLEAVVGENLIRRWAGGPAALQHARRVFVFAGIAGVIAPTVAASIGTLAVSAHHLLGRASAGDVWLTWWLGDSVGALLFAPLLLLWAERRPARWPAARVVEAILLLAATIVVARVVFGGWGGMRPLSFLCIPVVLWASFRFGQLEAAICTVIMSILAVRDTLSGAGIFAAGQNEGLLLLQAFMGVLAVCGLVVGALMREQERVTEGLEHRLLEAQALAHLGSWDWDIVRNEVWWSDEMCRIYDVEPGTRLTIEDFLTRVHPDDRERARAIVTSALTDRRPFAFEHRVMLADGEMRTLSARGRVLTDPDGRPLRMVGTGQDISDQKRAAEEHLELEREQVARRQAEEANRMKDQFLALVSHELRTPLNAVLGWAQLLSKGQVEPDKIARATRAIERNALVQVRLIEDLLNVSEFRTGTLRLEAKRVELGAVVTAAVESVSVAAQAKNIAVRLDLAGPAFVTGDEHRLQQIMWNLLSNAVKFTPDGGRVDVAMQQLDGQVIVRVTDTGRGLDAAGVARAFDAFWQADLTGQGGLGLGLAIVRALAEAHGGTVDVSSAGVGRGASFSVKFPVATHEQGLKA
jgi:signal transduction histidine kinase/integral membrane sensor domain MASE1